MLLSLFKTISSLCQGDLMFLIYQLFCFQQHINCFCFKNACFLSNKVRNRSISPLKCFLMRFKSMSKLLGTNFYPQRIQSAGTCGKCSLSGDTAVGSIQVTCGILLVASPLLHRKQTILIYIFKPKEYKYSFNKTYCYPNACLLHLNIEYLTVKLNLMWRNKKQYIQKLCISMCDIYSFNLVLALQVEAPQT